MKYQISILSTGTASIEYSVDDSLKTPQKYLRELEAAIRKAKKKGLMIYCSAEGPSAQICFNPENIFAIMVNPVGGAQLRIVE